MKTNNLILWVENLMEMAWEAYEQKDYDLGYFEEIKQRLKFLNGIDSKTLNRIKFDIAKEVEELEEK